jgi:nucleoside-diphosphate-sugar epimerase
VPEIRPVVIVTGSSGFIGAAVCRALISDGYSVVGFDRPDGSQSQPGVTTIPCDITDEDSVAQAVNAVLRECAGPIASVIHLAAYYDFSGEPSPLYDRITVQGTGRLLRLLKITESEQFVFSSTMLVHAPCEPGQHINEEWPLKPAWDYPRSKAKTERLILRERGRLPVVLLRIAGVYTDRCESVPIAHQIQRIYERRLTSKVFPGDTSRGQSFVHLDDVVEALRATVARRSTLPHEATILIGERDGLSYDELQRLLARHIHGEPDWDTTPIPKAVAKAGAWVQDQIPGIEEPFIKPWMIDLADDHYALDISRARALLGWSPRRSLRQALPRMVTALKSDPEAFYRLNKLEGEPPHHETAPAVPPGASTSPGVRDGVGHAEARRRT